MSIMKRLFCVFVAAMTMACVILLGCSPKQCRHVVTRIVPQAATCTENGNREYYKCDKCGSCFADEDATVLVGQDKYEIKAFGHNIIKRNEKQATCVSCGVKEHYECRNCHKLYSDDKGTEIAAPEETAKIPHNFIKVDAKAATEFDYGWKEHYKCRYCGSLASDKDGKNQVTSESITVAPINSDFAYKIAFASPIGLQGSGSDYISAEFTTADDLPATRFTFKEGAETNCEVEAWIIYEVESAKNQGIDLRIPTFNGKEKELELVVSNDGGQEISFRYYAENYGDVGGIDITIAPNQKQTLTFTINPGDTIGCNFALKLLCDVTTETEVTLYGFFSAEDEISGISLYKQASKKVFKVGDKFTSQGLVVKANGNNYDDVVIANYRTDIAEGYEFTSADVGTKTVVVRFGKYSVTYDITITE